jgi:hypothetical protein
MFNNFSLLDGSHFFELSQSPVEQRGEVILLHNGGNG